MLAARAPRVLAVAVALCAWATSNATAAEVYTFDGDPAAGPALSAAEGFEHQLPSSVAHAGPDRIEAQLVSPVLTSVGDHLSAVAAMGSPSIAKDPAGGFTLDTRFGPLRFVPGWTNGGAPAPGIAGDAAAVFPSLAEGVDALVRPTAVGMAEYLRISGPLAGSQFAWRADLPSGVRLCELPDGGIAVVAAPAHALCGPAAARPSNRSAPARERVAAARPQYDDARARVAAARSRISGEVVAVVAPPAAQDGTGAPLTTRLDAPGDHVALTVEHRRDALAYPVLAGLAVAYPDAWERRWTHTAGMGLTQPGPDGLIKILASSGKIMMTHGFDPKTLPKPGSVPEDDELDEYDQRGQATGNNQNVGGSPGSMPAVCGGSDTRRLTLVYAGPDGADGLTAAVKRKIRRVLGAMNMKLFGEAVDSGGSEHPARFVVSCDDEGRPAILPVAVDSRDFETVVSAAVDAGIDDRDSKYLVFNEAEDPDSCGLGDWLKDDRLSTKNLSNGLSSLDPEVEGGWAMLFGRDCWWDDAALHESAHTMGAVQAGAPGSNGLDSYGEPLSHCADGLDLMCYEEARDHKEDDPQLPAPYSDGVCTLGSYGLHYDCRHDSYFDTNPERGEWLNQHWNVGSRKNGFLSFAQPPAEVAAEPFAFWGFDAAGTMTIFRSNDSRGAQPSTLMSTADCAGCISVGSPALSPNGRQVLIQTTRESTMCADLQVMPIAGGPLRLVFDCAAHDNLSAYNPQYAAANGRIILEYVPPGDFASDVYTIRTDGTGFEQMVAWPGFQSTPTMSGSGDQLAFASSHRPDGTPIEGATDALFVTNRKGEEAVQMTRPDQFDRAEHPRFSYDGNRIVFEGTLPGEFRSHVYVVNIDGTGLRKVSTGVTAVMPEWTPRGKVVYGQASDDLETYTVVEVDPDDGSRRTLFTGVDFAHDPAFRAPAYSVPSDYEPPQPQPIP